MSQKNVNVPISRADADYFLDTTAALITDRRIDAASTAAPRSYTASTTYTD